MRGDRRGGRTQAVGARAGVLVKPVKSPNEVVSDLLRVSADHMCMPVCQAHQDAYVLNPSRTWKVCFFHSSFP